MNTRQPTKPHELFWENDFKIFGLHEITEDNQCGCQREGCEAAGKHPKMTAWQNVPVWSDEQFEALNAINAFESGYGVLCNGLLVVDVDERNGGIESYKRLCEAVPSLTAAGMIVNTGSGNGSMHLYFTNPTNKALKQKCGEYVGIDFKSSGFVVGYGSNHESGNKYELASGSPDNIFEAPDELLQLLEVPDTLRTTYDGNPVDFTHGDIESMLAAIDPDCDYDEWVAIGMAIHHCLEGSPIGLELWDAWSLKGAKYKSFDDLDHRFHGFGKSAESVTIGTLVHFAEKAGWVRSITFTTDEFKDEPDQLTTDIDVSGVDIRRPPGFVGRVTEWINSQCAYKRENLAVAAALTAVSNAGGMRFYDAATNMHANLYSVCVAGSGTGKNSILSAIKKLAASCDCQAALCGGIKSEQEIFRNLLRHQAAHYTIDEIGEILGKLVKAKKRGSASYLDAVIAILLTAYSSAGDSLLITGDLKQEIQEVLKAELKSQQKSLDKHESKNPAQTQKRIDMLKTQLKDAEEGIIDPYVSLFGLTTPVSFDSIMDFEMATNGFMARTLIFKEADDNPVYHTVPEEARAVPADIEMTLTRLYHGGNHDPERKRIERIGHKKSIETTDEARNLLDKIRDVYFWNLAKEHDGKTGLTSIPRRGAEMCEKISLILAMADGVRTLEHVRYAYAISSRDIDLKLNIALGNSKDGSDALIARILSLLDTKKAMTVGIIVNRCRNFTKEDVLKGLLVMTTKSLVKHEQTEAKNGRKTDKYYLMNK